MSKIAPLMLTQTDIMVYIKRNISTINPSFDIQQSLTSLGCFSTPVVSMLSTESAWDGYNRMTKHKLLALPIMKDGRLLSALSNSHLRGVDVKKLKLLAMPVMEFVGLFENERFVTCEHNDKFVNVLYAFEEGRLHRVWMMDGVKLMGVVTLTDIIKLFV